MLKPSEQDPSCAVLLAQLAQEAGLPDGVLNIGAAQFESFECLHTVSSKL